MRYYLILPFLAFLVALGIWWNQKPGTWTPPSDLNLETYLFYPDEERAPQTDALLIWKDNKLLFERYARGYTKDTPHLLWSVSKSISATFVGIAINDGLLEINDPIGNFFDTASILNDSQKQSITIDHLMLMSSGLAWLETYEQAPDRTQSSVGQMLYGAQASKDSIEYILSHPMAGQPGSLYNYSTGDTTLLFNALKALYSEDFESFPWSKLFEPLQLGDVTFERDQKGQFLAGSNIYMRARDLIKIGVLHLNKGVWRGERLLPEAWNDYVWSPNRVAYNDPEKDYPIAPGRHWWTNFDPSGNGERVHQKLPLDTVFAWGHWGQYMILIPSQNTVVVRFGEDLYEQTDQKTFFKLLGEKLETL